MKPYLPVCLLGVMLAGCDSPADVENKAQNPGKRVVLDVPAGEYRSHEIPGPGRRTDIRLSAAELRFNPQWTPMMSVCLRQGTAKDPDHCIQFGASERQQALLPRRYVRTGNPDAPEITTLKPRYGLRDAIDVSIRSLEAKTEFWGNGELLFEAPASSGPARLELFCSSIICNAELPQ